MSIVGQTLKSILALRPEIGVGEDLDLHQTQKEELRKLLLKAADTAFGKFYNYSNLVRSKDLIKSFQATVPIVDYHDLADRWWKQQIKHPDITWPGRPDFFALSSGTTGKKSKRIPITSDLLSSMRQVSLDQLGEIAKMDLPGEVFESETLAIASSADLKEKDGFYEGEISGINMFNLPKWFDIFFRPGKDIASIAKWEDRVEEIVRAAPEWNIGIISGIPSWVLICLKKIIKRYKLESINDIWPNAQVYLSGGVSFDTYEDSFRSLFKKDLHVIDTYMASEGYFAYGSAGHSMEMIPAISHGYFFEFVPFDASHVDENGKVKSDVTPLTIDEVEKEKDYVLVVSSCAGAWRYTIGDVVKFTSLQPHRMQISGRTKFFLNVAGSQLSEEKMDNMVTTVSSSLDLDINEYCVSAIKEGDLVYHHWVFVTEKEISTNTIGSAVDQNLREVNKNYDVARGKNLGQPVVHLIKRSQYQAYLKEMKKLGGQVKIPKIISAEKWSTFCSATGIQKI